MKFIINSFLNSYSQKKREQVKEIGRKNDCPHRMSRDDYEKAEKELIAAKRKRLEEEAQFNPSALCNPLSPICHENLWLYFCQKRSGFYTSEQTHIVANKIVSIVIVIFLLLNKLYYKASRYMYLTGRT